MRELLDRIYEAHVMGVEELMSTQYRELIDALAKQAREPATSERK